MAGRSRAGTKNQRKARNDATTLKTALLPTSTLGARGNREPPRGVWGGQIIVHVTITPLLPLILAVLSVLFLRICPPLFSDQSWYAMLALAHRLYRCYTLLHPRVHRGHNELFLQKLFLVFLRRYATCRNWYNTHAEFDRAIRFPLMCAIQSAQ